MKKGTTLFLKLALFFMAIPILALCIFFVPSLANYAVELYPDLIILKYLVFIDLYAAAIVFFVTLYYAYVLLTYIDGGNAFSSLSANKLKSIKYCAITISGLFTIGMPIYYLIAERDDAPGLIAIGLIIIFASLVIAVFAAVLQKLLEEAIQIKTENELTV